MRHFSTAALAAVLGFSSARASHDSAPVPPAGPRPLTPIVHDAGHGGEDLGAVINGRREKDMALAFARKLRDRLAKAGDLPVVMIRDQDVYVPLDRRLVESVDWSGGVFVSLHLNEAKSRRKKGAVIYSYGPEKKRAWRPKRHPSVPPMPAPPRSHAAESALLARELTRALREDGFLAEPDRSDYYVLKNPAQPSVLIELGYLSNPDEAARLADPVYQDRMIETLARALEDYAARRSLRGALSAADAPPSN